MKIYLVTFAEGENYKNSQRNMDSSLKIADIDEHDKWDFNKIKETKFYSKNKELLDKSPGYGFWAWKPYIILNRLNNMNDDDILIYMDASRYETDGFKNSCLGTINFMKKYNVYIIPGFKTDKTNFQMIKPSCLKYFGLENNKSFLNSDNTFTSPMILRKNDFTLKFIKEWLDACLVEDNVSPQNLTKNGGILHIYDQAVLNCLMYKYTIVSFKPETNVESEYRKFTYYFDTIRIKESNQTR